MSIDTHQKVSADHLRRDAFLYVRQSSLRQVFENTESSKRQYALRDRAVSLGWPIDRIHTIDTDLGVSGANAENRDGFQHLVSEVALGHAGIVLGLEVSRLARNNADWHRLLELAALTCTLILDEDGIYDPAHFNDRLLLGLKGTMSEAELHVLKARLLGGQRNKARRGELEMGLPIGLAYDAAGAVVLDPDQQIQQSIRLLFDTFREVGSATAVVRRFLREGIRFPRRIRRGIGKGDLVWGTIEHCRVIQILHNPRYAGAYVYGRTRRSAQGGFEVDDSTQGSTRELAGADPRCSPWLHLVGRVRAQRANTTSERGCMESGRSWSHAARGLGVAAGSTDLRPLWCPHAHPYLMLDHAPYYVCTEEVVRRRAACQSIRGRDIDAAVSALLLRPCPAALEVALAVHDEIAGRIQQAVDSRLTTRTRSLRRGARAATVLEGGS